MARVDVYHPWCGGGGSCSRWWEAASCFLNETGDGDVVVLINVVSVGCVGPFDVSELAEI